ncbi:MAG: hypothetical protein WBK55_05820 [Alphaproteobacteria bacterium]
MADHTPAEADPKEIQRARDMWHNVAQAGKWGIIGTVLILAGLALAFIDF